MEQRNNRQDCIIFEIESLLNKMSNQINFLIRKEMPINQLDIDLLMENTRKLYDTICSIELGARSEELGVEEDADSEVIEFEDENKDKEEEIIDFEDEDNDYVEDEDDDEYEDEEEDSDMVWDFTKDNEELGVRSEELGVEEDSDIDSVTESEPEEEPEEEPKPEEEDSGIRTYRIVRENVPTLSDLLEKTEDNSLAARLQRKPVSDLISAIGINDKFLFLNELFGGSMEKYNKSIRSLNSFSTLLGAKTYMSELQIEFQWDCSSDAYKKLADLVERRFISIHNA